MQDRCRFMTAGMALLFFLGISLTCSQPGGNRSTNIKGGRGSAPYQALLT